MGSTCSAAEWSCAGACGDTLEAALEQDEATLWYGQHCFEYSRSLQPDGRSLLRLSEASRHCKTAGGASVLVVVHRGYVAEERVPRCHGCADEAVLGAIEARLLRAVGRKLLADAGLAIDLRAAA